MEIIRGGMIERQLTENLILNGSRDPRAPPGEFATVRIRDLVRLESNPSAPCEPDRHLLVFEAPASRPRWAHMALSGNRLHPLLRDGRRWQVPA